jgi:hypothetical protein
MIATLTVGKRTLKKPISEPKLVLAEVCSTKLGETYLAKALAAAEPFEVAEKSSSVKALKSWTRSEWEMPP